MSDQFLGEIRIFAGNFAIYGWAMCQGQILPISQYAALFSLLGTTYGGNGSSNFALPNLQGAVPMQAGQGPGLSLRSLGEIGGSANVTVTVSELPGHTHAIWCATSGKTGPAGSPGPTTCLGSGVAGDKVYGPPTGGSQMNPAGLSLQGGSQPHDNMQPYLGLNYIIALQGMFPSRS